MSKIIIYPQNGGSICVVTPTGAIPVEEVARKDVPAGVPFLFVEREQLPSDEIFFNAWEADFSNPDGTGIGQQAWFIEKYNEEIAAINAEPAPQALVPASFDAAEFPEDFTEEQKTAAYAELVAFVTEQNTQALAQWEASKAARIEQLNQMIATQQAEMAA